MQLRIFPISPTSVAAMGRTPKMDHLVLVFHQFDVPANEQVFAFRTKAHFIERPPSLKWIACSKEPQFSAVGLRERHGNEENAATYFEDCATPAKNQRVRPRSFGGISLS